MYRETFDGLNYERLQKLSKPANLANVGDVIICDQKHAYVYRVTHWYPNDPERPESCINDHYVAVQVKTDNGDRWWGYSLSDHD
jgi:hypothetical protein